MAVERDTLAVWDYVVFSLMLAISSAIGIYFGCTGGKQKTTEEFLLADRKMGVLPVTLSLLASFMSAITLLGTPAEVYSNGTQYLWIVIAYIPVIAGAAYVYLPVFYKLKVTSVFEYLELRFHKCVRLVGSCLFILQMVIYMAIVIYAPSLALNAVTGLDLWASVFSIGLVCTFYTTLGGMKAVMWTDVFQICLMFAGLIAVLIKGGLKFNGYAEIWEISKKGGRIEFFNFDPDPTARHTVWSLVFGGYFTWVAVYGCNQAQIQRAITVPSLRKAQLALWINLPGLSLLAILTSVIGLVLYANFQGCDPKLNGQIRSDDQLLPLFVIQKGTFPPGVPGLFIASIFSGALSTVSSGLNSLAAVTLKDIVQLACFRDMSDARAAMASKILSFAYGLLCIGLTFVVSKLGGVLQAALALFGIVGGPVLGLFTLGMILPWANWKGAITGSLSALFLTLWIGIGAVVHKPFFPKPPRSVESCPLSNSTLLNATSITPMMNFSDSTTPVTPLDRDHGFYAISYMWYSTIAVAVTVVVGLVVSLITGLNNPRDVDSRLICPVFDVCACYLPARLREKLRCGVDYDIRDDDLKKGEEDVKNAYSLSGSKADIINESDVQGSNGWANPAMKTDEPPETPTNLHYETYM